MRILLLGFLLAALSASLFAKSSEVKTLESGVRIQITKQGTGDMPKKESVVKVHYRGQLENGTEFDSSFKRGEAAVFSLNRVIPCWTEGVSRMTVGSKATLTCPASTAYGERGAGLAVPPNSTLIFEIELLDILR